MVLSVRTALATDIRSFGRKDCESSGSLWFCRQNLGKIWRIRRLSTKIVWEAQIRRFSWSIAKP